MTDYTRLRRHAELVDRMAGALGLDLEEQVLRGELEVDDLGEAVLRCSGCSDPDGCEAWLARQGGSAEAAPAMCRNAELFAELKQATRV